MKSILGILFVFILLICFENLSISSEKEHTISVVPAYCHLIFNEKKDFQGFSIKGRYRYGISDFLNIIFSTSYFRMNDNNFLIIDGGLSYIIDAVEWVPEINFSAGYFNPYSDIKKDISISIGAGIDYRKWRNFSIGVEGNYYFLPRNSKNFPGLITAGLRISFYF